MSRARCRGPDRNPENKYRVYIRWKGRFALSEIEDEECEADARLNWRISYDEGARYEYLVQWSNGEETWEPEHQCITSPAVMRSWASCKPSRYCT